MAKLRRLSVDGSSATAISPAENVLGYGQRASVQLFTQYAVGRRRIPGNVARCQFGSLPGDKYYIPTRSFQNGCDASQAQREGPRLDFRARPHAVRRQGTGERLVEPEHRQGARSGSFGTNPSRT